MTKMFEMGQTVDRQVTDSTHVQSITGFLSSSNSTPNSTLHVHTPCPHLPVNLNHLRDQFEIVLIFGFLFDSLSVLKPKIFALVVEQGS